MYRVIFDKHIESIKKITGITASLLSVFAIIANMMLSTNEYFLINILIISTTLVFFLFSAFLKATWTYHAQVIIFIAVGVFTLIASEIYFIGDLICVAGIFYLYIYRIIKKFNFKFLSILTVVAIVLRLGVSFLIVRSEASFLVKRDSILAETLSATFIFTIILLIIYIFQNQINWYIMRSYLLEKYMRVGMNAANLVHEQNLEVITSHIDFAVETIQEGDGET